MKKIIILIILGIFLPLTISLAQGFSPLDPLTNLQIKIPGLESIAKEYPATCDVAAGQTSCKLPYINIYIKAIYNYSILVIGFLAAIAILIGGVMWLVSGGNTNRLTEAKGWIMGALTGVLILFTSYILLNEINPDLIGGKPLELAIIEEVPLVENGSESEAGISIESGLLPGTTCLSQPMSSFSGLVPSSCSDKTLRTDVVDGLKKAIAIANTYKKTLYITSANRTMEKQEQLYQASVVKNGIKDAGKYAAKPSCFSPHVRGVSIDVCLAGTASCGHIKPNAADAKYTDADVVMLQKIMKEAGWQRYCGEWWHFQYLVAPKVPCSP